jgi:hypothetical protein
MKRLNLVKSVTLVSLAVSFVSFGITAIGALIESSILMMFWYIGLTGIWITLMAAVVSSTVFLLEHGIKWMQKHFPRLESHDHYPPHAAA